MKKEMNNILNVLYQSNDNYAPITGVSMVSLMENNKELDEINIYVLNDEIKEANLNKMKQACEKYNRNLILIETTAILNKLKELGVSPFKGTYTTYFKLIAVRDLQLPTDRILQLDGDTVINGSLVELCNMDLNNYILSATYDCTMNDYKKFIDIPLADKYYNGGVLLINQKEWNKMNCTQQIINHLQEVRNGYYTVDQDLLNVLFRDKFKYLNLTYNFNSGFYIYGVKESLKMYDLKDEYFDTIDAINAVYDDPKVYHCMGAMTGRPWEEDSIHPQNNIYRRYMAMSPWAEEPLKKVSRKRIFKIQRFLYRCLPRSLYIPIHKWAQHKYLSAMNEEVQK